MRLFVRAPRSRALLTVALLIGLGPVVVAASAGATAPASGAWSIERMRPGPEPSNSPSAVSCPSTTDCVASSGGALVTTTDGGRRWTRRHLPLAVVELGGISCPTTSHCWVVGNTSGDPSTGALFATTDGGTTWSTETVPSGLEGLWGGISCADVAHCWALIPVGTGNGTSVIATTDGGSTWKVQSLTIGGYANLTDISCPTRRRCSMATRSDNPHFDGDMGRTSDGGRTWATGQPAAADFDSVSCPTASRCWAVGVDNTDSAGLAFATTDGGKTWAPETLPGATERLEGISCPTTSDCTAVGQSGVIVTTDGGSTWNGEVLPASLVAQQGVSCAAATACVAVGYTTTDAVILGQKPAQARGRA
jgi:photosystem II stability/assembly factor-like uncharacterized protein